MIGAWANANPVTFAVVVVLLALLVVLAWSILATNVRDVRRARWDAYRARWMDEREREHAAPIDQGPSPYADTGFTEPPTNPPRRYRPLREGETA